ncbi:MAG TPA: hypothetical protein DCL38_03045 [Lachnospiraceae bacterium]|nr:hypothetical protein [Lachnospiraceae bacterium]
MSDVVDRLINGFFEYESEKLIFSVNKIEASIVPPESFDGSFLVNSRGGSRVKGKVYSSCMRISGLTEEFDGQEFEIKYSFDSAGLEPGAVVKGDIQVISEAGEYFIPFSFTAVRNGGSSGDERVKNLFHFSNLAQTDWSKAVKTFYSSDFPALFDGNDRVHYDKYRGLSTDFMNEENVDRFLVAIKKKQPVEFKTDSDHYEFLNITSDLKCALSVKKTTWGHIDLFAKADCSFIELQKNRITADDFLGNLYNMEFLIREEALHEGRNYGRISLSAEGEDRLVLTVTARRRTGRDLSKAKNRELKILTAKLMKQYIAFRMKQINKAVWIKESLSIVERMNALDDRSPVSRLYQAQLLLMDKRGNEARWILEHVEREMRIKQKGEELYSYFLYLAALFSREEEYIDRMTAEIREMYEKTGSFRILWILLYMDTDFARNAAKKLSAIREQYKKGCHSPLLYIEAYNCFASNPSLLTEITEFELSVLYFAVRNNKLDNELLARLLMLSEKLKFAPDLLIDILNLAYKLNEDDEIVRVLCSLLIKENVTDEYYFEWYQRGVGKDLKITRLYEYYMYSIPLDHRIVIPKEIIFYFNLGDDLSYERKAFLYANLIRHRSRQMEIYEASLDAIRLFAQEQIEEEHIDPNLAYIYKHVLVVRMITPNLSAHFIRVLFAYELAVSADAVNAVVIQEELKGEKKYPVSMGYAYPVIFSHNYTVFTEDAKGRRTLVDTHKLHRLMDDALYLEAIRDYVSENSGFILYVCTVRNRYVYVDRDNVEYCRLLVESEDVIESYKSDIRVGLMRYYYDNNEMTTLDEYLLGIDTKKLRAKDRTEYTDYLVRRGMYEKAYETVTKYGAEELPAKICVRICSQMIAVNDEPDGMLVKLAWYAFDNGKYDLLTLRYLADNYKGLTRELRNLWRAARRFELDSFSLSEELLVQMMYTKTAIPDRNEIFEVYISEGFGSRVELAYLSWQAYEYFARERLASELVFDEIIKNHQQGEALNDACKLALLKHFAEDEVSMTPRLSEMLMSFLIEFLHRNIYYNFFREYKDIMPELSSYEDKYVIEYRTNPANRVVLHYLLEDSESMNEVYLSEEMRCLFGGVFSREFILFFGEKLQYYITEEDGNEEKLTLSESAGVSEQISGDDTSRYHILNDMGVAKSLKDESTLLELMKEYSRRDYFTEKAFSIL